MVFSANKIVEIVEAIKKQYAQVLRAHSSSWNDEVHTSFNIYIEVCKKCMTKLDECVDISQRTCNSLNKLNVEKVVEEANRLSESSFNLAESAMALSQRTV